MLIDSTGIKRILIINLAFIGDVLLSTPVARALRQSFPNAVIDMMVIPLAAPIASGNPYINDVLEYDKRGKHKKLLELLKLVSLLRSRHYDLAVTTNFAPRGAMVAWAAGIRYRVGYDAQNAGWFLTHVSSANRSLIRHESENYLDVLRPLGISTKDTSLALNVKDEDIYSLQEKVKIDSAKKLVIICPVGSYQQKSWTTSGFAELIRQINPWAECYLIGARGDAAKLAEINNASGNIAGMLPGTLSLGELAALLAQAKLLVTVDTGPMHIANAVGTPIIALFGPTDHLVWGPRGMADIVLRYPRECSPCWGREKCNGTHCMSQIEVAEVIAAVHKVAKEGDKS